ncbi:MULTISPECIES: hypothetical protein [Bacteroidaceae]|uniref:hypothetical protein n=2 Tax=Bacteroidales TaxID=171549 RepID=UPI001956D192|nr:MULTISPECIES: hypothetical protein [Bacteroidaceae]MBM6844271.1 hypothetical protein [Phocaeicola plebeius]MCL1617722.1 hypothetical protein [Bacteroides sp. ET71]
MNIKSNILGCLSYIGIAIEFLLIIQTYIFLDMGKYGYMLVTGSLAVIPFAIMYWNMRRSQRREEDNKKKHKEWLRSKGVALEVDLNSCKISENKRTVHYTRMDIPAYSLKTRLHAPASLDEPDLPYQSWRSQSTNASEALMNPDRMYEPFSYERCYCIVKATLDYKGKRTQFFSEPILMDKCSLGVFLALHKSGIIYVNPRNKKDYFFDLDFLKQE